MEAPVDIAADLLNPPAERYRTTAGYDDIYAPRPKRIIICCDGTWQSAVSGQKNAPSNITRLVRDIDRVGIDENGQQWQQIVWYDSGVGTTSGFLGVVYEGAVGAGLEGNVIEAYNFVCINWNPGDKIYCFGFSRGAYTARTIAGLITDIGICDPDQLHNFHDIWAAYKANDTGERFYAGSQAFWDYFDGTSVDTQTNELKLTGGHYPWSRYDAEVEIVGVFDTVGSIGLPSMHGYKARLPFGPDKTGFHNVRLNRRIRRAFHALALDEHRESFTPTLWHLPEQVVSTKEELSNQFDRTEELSKKYSDLFFDTTASQVAKREALQAYQQAKMKGAVIEEQMKAPSILKQVWFPGVHISSGGGSLGSLEGKGDMEELSTIAFAWMVDQIKPHISIGTYYFGYQLQGRENIRDSVNRKVEYRKQQIEAENEAYKKSTASQRYGQLFSSMVHAVTHPIATYNGPNNGEVLQEKAEFDWGTGPIIDSYTLMYKLGNGEKVRTPGGYAQDPKSKHLGDTCEEIHPTVGYRMKMTEKMDEKTRYHPAGRKDVQRRKNGQGAWEYVFGDVVLPEYKLKPEPVFASEAEYYQRENEAVFERTLVASSGEAARQYLAELDKGN